MYCKKTSVRLIKNLLLKTLFVLCSSSALSFSSEDRISIVSDSDICTPANYEGILARIENFASYREIDDHIVWSNIQAQWLLNAIDIVLPQAILQRFSTSRKLLDMTESKESTENPQEDELKRSRVWMVFSPLELPIEFYGIYPKIPLICSISEPQENEIIHRCNQVDQIKNQKYVYAVQSFSSELRISNDDDCGIRSFFRIVFNLHRQQVDTIYRSIVNHYEWPNIFLGIMQRADKNELFSLYFQNLYNQLLL